MNNGVELVIKTNIEKEIIKLDIVKNLKELFLI